MKKTQKIYKGSCLCGAIRFKLEGPLDGVWFCHCAQCRKNYGLYGAFVSVEKDQAQVMGEKNIRWYRSSEKVRRGFCKTCGSPIMWAKDGHSDVCFLPGLINGKLRMKKGAHIFVRNKGHYYSIHDTLKQFK